MGPLGASELVRIDVSEACSVLGDDGRAVAFDIGVQSVLTSLAERLIAVGNAARVEE